MRYESAVLCTLAVLATCGLACSSVRSMPHPESARLLAAAYYNGMAGFELVIFTDHEMVLRGDSARAVRRRMDDRTWVQLEGLLASPAFGKAVEVLKERGYRPGCCDTPEVAFLYRGEAFGFPVCTADGSDVEPSIGALVDTMNALARATLGRRYSRGLPRTWCPRKHG